MSSLIVAINAIVPVTAVIVLGYMAKSKGVVHKQSYQDFNKVVFQYCLPLSIFQNIINADLSKAIDPVLLGYCILITLGTIFISIAALRFVSLSDTQKGVIAQAIYRSNFVILGLPIVGSICGADNTGVTTVMIAFVTPVINVAAVLVLEHYSEKKGNLKQTIINLSKNRIITFAIAAMLVKIIGIEVPEIVMLIIAAINKMTTPLALFVLGGTFEFQSMVKNSKLLVIIGVCRLIVVPLVGLTGAVLLGYHGAEIASMLVLFGGPVAVSSYPMAQEMGMDGDLAAQAVLTTTIMVLFTLFIYITILNSWGIL